MTPEQKYIADLIKNRPVKIAHKLGFKLLTDLHNEWLKMFLFGEDDLTLQAHRGSYKTTDVSAALALIILIKPYVCTLFMRKTESDIKEVMATVSNILKSEVFKELCKVLHGSDLILLKDTQNEISTNLQDGVIGTPQLTGLGSTSSLTGKHYHLIFTDDIVNLKDRVSKAERERTKLVYMELQNLKNRGGRIVNTGTKWHKEDCFTLMPKPKIYDCYSTGLMTNAEIEDVKTKLTPSLFAANYLLKHISDDEALFKDAQYCNDEEFIYNGIAHIDASYGGEDTTAFTIFKHFTKDVIINEKEIKAGTIIGFGKVYERHVDKCLPDIFRLKDLYRAGTIYLEKNADKGYLGRDISREGKPVGVYNESMNKYIKISTFLYKVWYNIKWLDTTDEKYLNQILDFREGQEPDDAPDSAASLIRVFDRKTTWEGRRPI